MYKGEHSRGGIEAIEANQVRAWCECGWSVRVTAAAIKAPDEKMTKAFAEAQAKSQLEEHQSQHNDNYDKGVQL